MATNSAFRQGRRIHGRVLAATFAALLVACLAGSVHATIDPELLEGRAPTKEELRPSVEAAFRLQSATPNSTARLVLFNRAPGLTLQLFRSGPERQHTFGYSEMQGVAVTSPRHVGAGSKGRVLSVAVGNWRSGLYFARLTSSDGRIGFAPIVVRPQRLGSEARVAVVLPTLTWQAYNLRDDDGDGVGDSWYADWDVKTARLARPFLNRGVPYSFRKYDLPFLNWLAQTHRSVEILSDADVYGAHDGDALARAYDLIVFPGHHEYVTTHEYDVVSRYRDLGGNLAFLSANNFFWQTVIRGNVITRTKEWRDLGRPEGSLLGVEYRGNDRGGHRGPWIIRNAASWLFQGTGLGKGSTFGSGGIEIDKTGPSTPAGTQVIAEIPNLFGKGFTAQMTYYETKSGAKVFSAGAFTMAGSVSEPTIAMLVANLWTHLAETP
jgi:hypothetical protein